MSMEWAVVLSAVIATIPPTIVSYLAWQSSRTVHTIVNSQRTEMMEKIASLERTITRLSAPSLGGDD